VRVLFDNGARAVFRLSGTGTEGATVRVYLENFEPDPARHDLDPQGVLASVMQAADAIGGIRERTGREKPDMIT
jgi:phosphoglucomutase